MHSGETHLAALRQIALDIEKMRLGSKTKDVRTRHSVYLLEREHQNRVIQFINFPGNEPMKMLVLHNPRAYGLPGWYKLLATSNGTLLILLICFILAVAAVVMLVR